MLPHFSLTIFAAASTLLASETSSSREMTPGSGLPASLAAERTSSSTEEREERAAMAIFDAPALAYEMAVALPTPFEAPVTNMALPDRLTLVGSMVAYVSWWIVFVKLLPTRFG
jgi:hypothetical protein